MVQSRNVPVRFSEEMLREMERAAELLGLQNRSDLVKVSVKSLLDYVRRHGAKNLRVDFALIARDLDGRTHRYKRRKSRGVSKG